jgi:conserved oligomeric Golgi complex subunit 6
VHGQDLVALRAESQATIEQLRAAHQSSMDGLKADYEDVLASRVGELEKKLSNQSLELRATQDDLTKAKAALDSSRTETESLKAQLEDARAAFASASASPDQASEIDRLTKELASFRDENVMLNDVLAVTKESLSEMSSNHTKELEEAARGRVEDVMKIRAAHDDEITTLASQKSELSLRLSDMEGEIATLRAQATAVAEAAATAPKSNGASPISSTMVTREELQKAHEAHNMKMHDLVAEHERTVRSLRGEIDGLQGKLDELHQDITRKSMEIQYLEQEQDENQDSIIRYVKVFGLQSLFGVVVALAVIFDFI